MDTPSFPVLPGSFFKSSDCEAESIEIDVPSILAMTDEQREALSPVEYRFLEWLVSEGRENLLAYFTFERCPEGPPSIHDTPQSEICAMLLEYHGVPLPAE